MMTIDIVTIVNHLISESGVPISILFCSLLNILSHKYYTNLLNLQLKNFIDNKWNYTLNFSLHEEYREV